jgi:3-phosphoshikimate 1-carboxyvinyltransferase
MTYEFPKVNQISGELSLNGDKSISHRAVIFSSLADGISFIENLSNCEDVRSTISACELLGAEFTFDNQKVLVRGTGKKNFSQPRYEINCGNSGTTARLLSGVLAHQKFKSTITGDSSLSSRPMKRIIEPLELMGARIIHNNFKLPMTFIPSEKLTPIEYELQIPSAQVKSAILISGLFIDDKTKVIETIETRDHTERMLDLEYELVNGVKIIFSSSKNYPNSAFYFIPGDISSAAFFIVLTLLTKNSQIVIKNVCINLTRIGFIDILKRMNAEIVIEPLGISNGEPFGNVIVKSSDLKNVEIQQDLIPNIIDEIPILSLAGIFAVGNFTIRNCKELRFKESDRIAALCYNYKSLGLDVEEFEDGFSISGSIKKKYGIFKTYSDHRIAMTFAVLSMLLKDGGKIDDFECIKISNPDFLSQLKQIIKS